MFGMLLGKFSIEDDKREETGVVLRAWSRTLVWKWNV